MSVLYYNPKKHTHYLEGAEEGVVGKCRCGEVVIGYHNQSVYLSFRPISPSELIEGQRAGWIPWNILGRGRHEK